jgi:hypothetical protein
MSAHRPRTGLQLRNARVGSKADIGEAATDVRFTPKADIAELPASLQAFRR